jgi:hypothetical protein
MRVGRSLSHFGQIHHINEPNLYEMYIYIELEYWKTEILQASESQSGDMTSTKSRHLDQGEPHYMHGPLFMKICSLFIRINNI